MPPDHDLQIQPTPEPPAAELPEVIMEFAAKREIGGRPGMNPTRHGDWEKAGLCIDF